jgi:6-phosphogluconate dehydrogenase
MNTSAAANIGVVGLAVMGSNLARNLASREGNTVAVYNRTHARTEELVNGHPEAGFITAASIDEFVASLARPRTAIIMVQAGAGTDAVIDQLAERFEPGDIIIDGGNANFQDSIAREQRMAPTGIHFVGVGVSGGEEGALNGPSIMPGGSEESYRTLGPILASIAAVAEGEPCVTHVGTDGAGHFVKMIHNGIEYADMQLIGEAYDLLRTVGGLQPRAIADIFAEWNKGPLESYLIEITAEILRQVDATTKEPFVDVVLDQAGSKGTGVWTVQNAVPSPPNRRSARRCDGSSPPARKYRRPAPPSRRTSPRPSTLQRSSPTRRASTPSSPAPRSTAGTSTRTGSPRSGAAAASSVRASSTA